MNGSAVVAFRALVMLSCLILVPLAAILGSAFPDLVKTMLVDRFISKSAPAIKPAIDAPRFAAASGYASQSQPGTNPHGSDETARFMAAPHAQLPSAVYPTMQPDRGGGNFQNIQAGGQIGDAPGIAQRARFEDAERSPAPAWPPAVSGSQAGGGFTPPGGAAAPPAPFNSRPDAVAAHGAAAPPVKSSHAGSPHGGPAPLVPEQAEAMARRLRECGATYYLLEYWGGEKELYRFHCQMAIANNAQNTRHFEATDVDAVKAVARVLEQVEAWRAGRWQ